MLVHCSITSVTIKTWVGEILQIISLVSKVYGPRTVAVMVHVLDDRHPSPVANTNKPLVCVMYKRAIIYKN